MLRLIVPASIALLSLPVAFAADAAPATPVSPPLLAVPSMYIVQGPSVEAAEQSVEHVAASVERPLGIINAVSAYLTLDQAEQLRESGLHVYADRKVAARGLFSYLGSLTAPLTSTTSSSSPRTTTPLAARPGTKATSPATATSTSTTSSSSPSATTPPSPCRVRPYHQPRARRQSPRPQSWYRSRS